MLDKESFLFKNVPSNIAVDCVLTFVIAFTVVARVVSSDTLFELEVVTVVGIWVFDASGVMERLQQYFFFPTMHVDPKSSKLWFDSLSGFLTSFGFSYHCHF